MKKGQKEGLTLSENPIDNVYNGFFGVEEIKKRYGLNNEYTAFIFNLSGETTAQGFRVLKDTNECKEEFKMFLFSEGYIPKNDGEVIGATGSIFKDKFLNNWLRYIKEGEPDLWVNYEGIMLDGWQDIFITTTPNGINSEETAVGRAFFEAIKKQARIEDLEESLGI